LQPAADGKAEFGGEDDAIASPLQRAAEQFLIGERAIDFGRIEKGAAEFDGAMDGGSWSSGAP
jgi:hypothetical protein